TAGARPRLRIASSATQRATFVRITAATVVASSTHAPVATTVCTITIARRLRAATFASNRNPNGPGPARKRRLHTGARALAMYTAESGPYPTRGPSGPCATNAAQIA